MRSPTARPAISAPSDDHPCRTRPACPATSGGRRRPAGVCHHHAVSRHACAASASARPGRSLIGRTARSRRAARPALRRAVAARAAGSSAAMAASPRARARSAAKPSIEQERQRQRRQQREQRQRRASIADAQRRHAGACPRCAAIDFAERDVDGIAGRMRTMVGDIEVANAEREVHRVDVFERGGATNGRWARPTTRASAASARVGVTIRVAAAAPR